MDELGMVNKALIDRVMEVKMLRNLLREIKGTFNEHRGAVMCDEYCFCWDFENVLAEFEKEGNK